MKQLFLISFVLWLSIGCLLAQKDQNSDSLISFGKDFSPGQLHPLVVIDGDVFDSLRLATYVAFAINKNQITLRDRSRSTILTIPGNPDDIETITVLKNETAVNLYGEKAKNGVLVINTKGAKNKADKIQKE